MTCKHVQARLSAYQDGELSAAWRERVAFHLEECHSCGDEWRLLEQLYGQLKRQKEIEPAPVMAAQIMSRLKSEPVPRRRLLPSMVYAAAFLLVFTLGFLTTLSLQLPAPTPQQTPRELAMISVLLDSQNLRLLNVQAQSLNLLEEKGRE